MKTATPALLVLASIALVCTTALSSSGFAPVDNLYLEARKLVASDGAPADQFGRTVAISGDTAIVGALADDDGCPPANPNCATGSAYIFERDAGSLDSWAEVAKLTASDAAPQDQFGVSVAIDGNVAVVGAFADDGLRGAAYLYERHAGGPNNWGQVVKLVASDRQLDDRFGNSVAISGNTVLVGALLEDGGCPPLKPKCASGSAYIFERNHGGANQWGEVTKVLPTFPQLGQTFGNSVSLSGDYAAIGAVGDPTGAVGQGAAFIMGRNAGGANNWGQVRKITASDGNYKDFFGWSIGIANNTVVAGAYAAEMAGVGNFVGAAYVFEKDYPTPGAWGEYRKLTASDAQFDDQFGISVGIMENGIIVGAFAEDTACRGTGCDAGKAYIYGRNTGGPDNWGEIHPVVGSDIVANDWFGVAVAITQGAAIVGAYHKPNEPLEKVPGAAYVFTTPRPALNFFKYSPVPEPDSDLP